MSSFAGSLALMSHLADSLEPDWITPKEQLERLPSSNATLLTKRISEMSEIPGMISDLAQIVAEYAVDDRQLDGWYTSLQCINRLPQKLPPLPKFILEMLNEPCPNEICSKKKPNKATYAIGEKCTLTLVTKELGTINEIENIVKDYGARQYPKNENPLQFRYFWDTAREEHGNMPPEPTHWVLHTNDVLENSRNQPSEEQVELVNSLAKKSSKEWQVPNLRDTIATIFLKKIATGERLYQVGNDQNKNICTYTRVKETTNGWNLIIGSFAPVGLGVLYCFVSDDIGVAALRKF